MKKQTPADLQQDYLDAIDLTVRHMAGSSPAHAAETLARFAADLSRQPGPEFAELRVIALLGLSRVQQRLQQTRESEGTRQQAISALDQIGDPGARVNIQDRLADVLIEFAEYRRAIGPCQQAISLSGRKGIKAANRLWRAGRTYLRAGFPQHAEQPLRSALEFFRAEKNDQFTPVILTDLGNALRVSDPAQADKAYREAAALWEKGGAYAQAATAWVNLGILCGEQGRLEESLQWYEKVRRVRQADPGTTHARLGSLANNIANLYRRMKNFELATREVEDAIRLLQGDPLLAHAYGTYGLILQDQGFDDPAVEWFRKSRVEHARHPSPNVARLSEALGNEAGALRRLGRSREAAVLERQRVELQGEVPALRAVPAISKLVAGEAGEVRIELDGIHLAPEVYRDCDLATFENRLEEVLERGDYGELDGHETGPETTTVFLYGADAKALFGAVEPVLRDYPLCQGARVTIRQDGRERQIVISA